ncbi:Gcv operon activator [Tritonibacter multivorans]|uniref:Gcv operon activator n=1 Tax=Tritonibacter multivorans TaxID=928856 RepID=A0A0P1GFC0_9RHOB|nr:LysR substrate-binding domain-containing protein [Tritonibacter multivorans]MDA7421090.1 LysR substrate-binding domain-containing protein [Tritonibacter multivorans]CUH80196.1 Gcv operon activator [Tritonibacter multivorans]SFC75601.1 transcriptional regulator, LysR family [Tritonibacter multivorans]
MVRRHYNLPPLNTLATFEAAARHGSFKEAAAELSVTPGAVSHQVKALEEELGAPLFHRRHRGVELTHAGQSLLGTLSSAFGQISTGLQGLRQSSMREVTIGATTAMATLWLAPALMRFWRVHPDITVNQLVQDRPFVLSPELDMFIWYGTLPDPHLGQFQLFRDELVPVTSPAQAEELREASAAEVAKAPLIHQDYRHLSWTNWNNWFANFGHKTENLPGRRVNNYSIALLAAQDGQGLALGWRRLVAPLLASGELVALDHLSQRAPETFYLICKPDEELSPSARDLRDWLVAEAGLQTQQRF